jgi:hypothetical protein
LRCTKRTPVSSLPLATLELWEPDYCVDEVNLVDEHAWESPDYEADVSVKSNIAARKATDLKMDAKYRRPTCPSLR